MKVTSFEIGPSLLLFRQNFTSLSMFAVLGPLHLILLTAL